MRRSYDVYFASSNRHKYGEAKEILQKHGIRLGFFRFAPVEIQSKSLSEIAKKKALDAYEKCRRPVIVEDAGLFIDSLGGFPGPYSSYVLQTVGNRGVLRLVGRNRRARFVSVAAFCDAKKRPAVFEGVTEGRISKRMSGGGWGYDPIFVPLGRSKTYAQLDEKNEISHRAKALAKFSSFYRRRSSGR